ncbi:MAG: protease modulator HflC [Pseudomonadota bacterium]
MSALRTIVLVIGVLLMFFGSLALFTVDEREFAVKLKFGEIVKYDYEPGLHVKIPVVNNVLKFDRRILTINTQPEEFLTNEKKNLRVNMFVKWRITDPAQYYRSTAGIEELAEARLLEIIKDGIRAEFAKRTLQQAVTAERSELQQAMISKASATASELGVSIVDVRVKKLDLPDEVSDSVFARMRQERNRVAKQLRAEGAESSEVIRSEADRDSEVIRAEGRRESQTIRGEGDARSADIYAQAYNRDREFYSFYRSMEAYRNSIGLQGDVLVLEPDSDFFRYLNKAEQPSSQLRAVADATAEDGGN